MLDGIIYGLERTECRLIYYDNAVRPCVMICWFMEIMAYLFTTLFRHVHNDMTYQLCCICRHLGLCNWSLAAFTQSLYCFRCLFMVKVVLDFYDMETWR